jgi:hypothetical protein
MGLFERDLQHSRKHVVAIERQEEKGLGSELAANRRLNPGIGICVLNPENLRPGLRGG